MQAILVSSDASAVVLTHCVAYSTGFQIGVGIRYRVEPERPRFASPMRQHYEPPEMSLVIGIRFADGRESQRGLRRGPSVEPYTEPAEPVSPIISGGGGGGGGRSWDHHYWVAPLPPDGPMTVTCHWPAGGLPDGSAEIDGSAIRRAGESSQKLWTD